MAFNFKKKIDRFKKMQRDLPKVIGNIAKKHFTDSFRNQGFTDVSLDPWEQRKRGDKSDRNRPREARAILVKTGHGKNSIRVKTATFKKIVVGSFGVPYMVFHNRGVKGRLPKRQFIGKSRQLDKKIKARINKEMKKVL